MAGIVGTTEAAQMCGVDRTTFFKWMQAGRINPVGKVSDTRTGALIFDRDDVEELRVEQDRRKRFGACLECKPPTWGLCEHRETEGVAS